MHVITLVHNVITVMHALTKNSDHMTKKISNYITMGLADAGKD